ncbi:zinc finger, C3HC4 type [Dictyocaulus viviparus]|uniref:Zinc finger, C3HC4 type n=1 Tax=Dictyocaulus viviparus TaxID=29172 RepID=A0A0D8XYW4_DICVI|nr:zinc finger, C3HC4 type [Dictyocaulus viviparus]
MISFVIQVEEGVSVGCLTTDFAVQNVLFKMNLSLVSLNGYRIKQLRSSVLRCRGCFTTTSIMTKQFCPACGNKLLHKCAVSVDENGDQVLHINWQRLANKRGLKHSIPAPKGGKHAVNEKLFEDQPMPQNRMATIRSDPFGENPFPMHDVTSRSAMLGLQTLNSRQKRRWNPNESKSRKHNVVYFIQEIKVAYIQISGVTIMSTVYYCHQCRNNVPLRNTDMICGVCGGEFLEQISIAPVRIHPRMVHHPERVHFHRHHHPHPASPQRVRVHLQQGPSQNPPENVLGSIMGMINSFTQPNQQQSVSSPSDNDGDITPSNERPQGVTFSLDQAMQMHPILSQVLATLGNPNMQVRIHIGDDGDGIMHGPFGDYVWGENGMDRIVTQLFNQMDGSTRPVGLTDQQINRLPVIKVSEHHVEKATQCTTCFEDFKLGELVVELLCRHIFHSHCVVPWLQQRPSCPICRQEVIALQFPEPAPGAPTVSSLEAKHDLIEPELD